MTGCTSHEETYGSRVRLMEIFQVNWPHECLSSATIGFVMLRTRLLARTVRTPGLRTTEDVRNGKIERNHSLPVTRQALSRQKLGCVLVTQLDH